ncbi:MAG TPA: TolC family protein [Firmicutes bacterium]|nr:TolC family protein [Bacillota bacterium]
MKLPKYLIGISAFLFLLIVNSFSEAKTLTVQDCIEIAKKNNLSFKAQEFNLFIARLNNDLAKSNFKLDSSATLTAPNYNFYRQPQYYPGFPYKFMYEQETTEFKGELSVTQPLPSNGSVSLYSYLKDQDSNYNIYNDEHEITANTGITFRQPLFKINTLKTALTKAEYEYQKALNTFEEQTRKLEYEVKDKFYNVLYAKAQVEIDKENVSNSEYIYKITQEKILAGLLPEIDKLTVSVDLANNISQLMESELNLENQKNELKRYLDIPLSEEIVVQGEITLENDINISLEELEKFAFENRSDLKNLILTKQSMLLDLREVKYRKRITADLVANYGYEGRGNDLTEAFDTYDSNRWGVGITIDIPIFDWGRKDIAIETKELQIQSMNLQIAQMKSNIAYSVRSNYLRLESSRNRLKILEKNKEQARENLKVIQMKFELGMTTLESVNAAQLSLKRAELNELKAKVDFNSSIHQIKIEAGI